MPTRARQSYSRAAAQPEEAAAAAAYSIPGLDFNEPLSWPAGRPIAVADLLSRLNQLSNKLRGVEDGAIDIQSIQKLAQDLVNPNLLGHKDKGVRAWTICCVVDILNLCAPNAPYRHQQLKDIFTVIINSILPALADPSNAYNAQHQYILDNLVGSQSIVLIADLQDADTLLTQLFSVCFDVVSGSGKNTSGIELAQSSVFQITVLLNTVIEEADLPQDVVDVIISQFLRVDPRSNLESTKKRKGAEAKDKAQSTLLLKDYPPAYNLAKSVCTAGPDKMSASISQYFSNVITNAGASLTNDSGSRGRGHTSDSDSDHDDAEGMNDLRKAHRLVRELWRACPDVLANVIPQLEVELVADSIALRQLAVETLGDLVAGIGLAGLPDLPLLDPAMFPLPTIDNTDIAVLSTNELLKPSAPKPFISVHASTYQAFLGRRIDKATAVRNAWTIAANRILLTRAGGTGLNAVELATLVSSQAKMLKDVDERVRLSTLQTLETIPYHTLMEIVGSDGGLSQPSSLLSVVAERVTDKKLLVREQAMFLLGSMWGVASRDIANGNDRIHPILHQAPSRLLHAIYTKDSDIMARLPTVLYNRLLPLTYPPIKGKVAISETQGDGDVAESSVDPDSLRVRRLLSLVRDLDDKAKPVFFGIQKRQADMGKGMTTFLKACEDYNGGVADDSAEEKRLEAQLNRFIDQLAKLTPDAVKASNDLWKFAKAHNRRVYQLIRFAIGPEHEYRTMAKAIKELKKRLTEDMSSSLDTVMLLVFQCALISYNRSHIPSIMEYARSSEAGYAETAQELLREISEKVPEVMKSHIETLCTELEVAAPSEKEAEAASTIDSLKACSAFARRFPDEVSRNRKFLTALQNFALYSRNSKAAKHAATIILVASDKKELRAREIVIKAIKRYKTEADNKVSQLAALAQVCLLVPSAVDTEEAELDAIVKSTIQHNEDKASTWDPGAWTEIADRETAVKETALKILVNRCRADFGKDSKEKFDEAANATIQTLVTILENEGELEPTNETPSVKRNHLRLTAALYLLKLCRHKPRCEELISPQSFHTIAWILVSPPYGVRGGLVTQLKKHLGQDHLSPRWFTLLFLLPFEPDDDLRLSTVAWLKSRAKAYAQQQKQARARSDSDKKAPQNVMELVFARLLSLLAHHPDFPVTGEVDYNGQLLDFAKYIIFYLQCVATEDNLSLIFHVAQRIKQTADALSISDETDDRLYILSDLAQATIRNYADQMPGSNKGNNILQTWPGKAHLPNTLFKAINGHNRAQEIAAKNYLPEEVALGLEALVRKENRIRKQGTSAKSKAPASEKKRKSSVSIDLDDDDDGDSARRSAKKNKSVKKTTSLAFRETPNPKKRKSEKTMSVEQPSRKSARTSTSKKVIYEESDEEEGDDTDDIVKYKPAPMDKYKHKHRSKKAEARPETPAMDEEDEEQAEGTDGDASEVAASPTPAAKQNTEHASEADQDGPEQHGNEPEDVEMTNGHGNDDAQKDIDEDQEGEAEDDDEEEVEEPPSPAAKRSSRASKTKATSKSAPPSTTKLKSKAVAKPKSAAHDPKKAKDTPTTKSKDEQKKNETKVSAGQAQAASSPAAAEPSKRATRRTKA